MEELNEMKKTWEEVRRHRRKKDKIKFVEDPCSNEMCGCIGEDCCEEKSVCVVENSQQGKG
eukprot:2084635-Karenia_brevis.AAC.1